MESLIEILRKSTEFLSAKGVENARLNAELLFSEVLKCKRLDLYLMFERPMTEQERDAIRPLIMRRGKREPLQQIIGHTDFYGMKLICDKRALIPRPETEDLVARLAERLKENTPVSILDLGTGSGALDLGLAETFQDAKVTGIDRSAEAISLAQENAEANGMTERVTFSEGNWFQGLPQSPFDLIVSNPPYLTEAEWNSAQPEVRDFDPHDALVGGGEDGGDDLRLILQTAYAFLKTDGLLALETGIAQMPSLENTAKLAGYSEFSWEKDDTGRPRYFFARK